MLEEVRNTENLGKLDSPKGKTPGIPRYLFQRIKGVSGRSRSGMRILDGMGHLRILRAGVCSRIQMDPSGMVKEHFRFPKGRGLMVFPSFGARGPESSFPGRFQKGRFGSCFCLGSTSVEQLVRRKSGFGWSIRLGTPVTFPTTSSFEQRVLGEVWLILSSSVPKIRVTARWEKWV